MPKQSPPPARLAPWTRPIGMLFFSALLCSPLWGQATLSRCLPSALEPGKTTRVVIEGKGFKEPIRISTDLFVPGSEAGIKPLMEYRVEKVEETRLTVEFSLADKFPLGGLGLWIGTVDGPSELYLIEIDELASRADNGENHQRETAQEVTTRCAIEGTSDGPQSDFYRFRIDEPQRIAFEVRTQSIGSSMDAVIRLWDPNGKVIGYADDDQVGPDPKLEYRFTEPGDYCLEVRDNRFATGGRYRLRIGDFPISYYTWPIAAPPGAKVSLTSIGSSTQANPSIEFEVPRDRASTTATIPSRFEPGKPASWTSLLIRDIPIVVEPSEKGTPIDIIESGIPFGISGRLQLPKERDSYPFKGTKGQAIRFASQTRSIGAATLLQMRLFNKAGAQVAETTVAESDEWILDYTIPEDGVYKLEVNDLLQRGGREFGYWIEASEPSKFSVTLKPDAKTKDRFAVAQEHGALAIDLQVARNGYEGPIEVLFEKPIETLKILNPILPAKAKDGKIYVVAREGWIKDSISNLRFEARATELPKLTVKVSSGPLKRVRSPHLLFPDARSDGLVSLAGTQSTPAPFRMEHASIAFAKPLNANSGTLQLKRLQATFKEAVSLLPNLLPDHWSLATKVDKENYKFTLTRPADSKEEPSSIQLLAYSEHQGRGRSDQIEVPIRWIDPVAVKIELSASIVPGQSKQLLVQIVRDGNDPQPVQLKWSHLPPGIVGDEKIEVAADQTSLFVMLRATKDLAIGQHRIQLEATSKYDGSEFKMQSEPTELICETAPVHVEFYPKSIRFAGSKERSQMVVTGFDSKEEIRDWTRDCTLVSSNEAVVRIRDGLAVPTGNGKAEIKLDLGTIQHTIPVEVEAFEVKRPIAFENEVLVALSKQGCNSGACHGSPSGKGNFRLSLRAFDKKLDQLTLIREDYGRRVNVQEAEQSLLLLKPLMKMSHGGGMQLHKQDAAYQILRDWIDEGAKSDPVDTPRCVQLEIYPSGKRILNLRPGKQQLSITARYSDGSQKDVTHLVAYESSNQNVAIVGTNGLVTARQRGEAAILVRYLEHIESISMTFVEEVKDFEWKRPPINNYIDEHVYAKLKLLQYLPSETCTDAEFLRRIHLDVTGLLPTAEEAIAFLNDPAEDKRDRLIDTLLDRPEYSKFWALKWCDLLKVTSKIVGDEGVYKYHRWVEQSLRDNIPYDDFARQLLTASGSTLSNPPANFYRTATDMNECVENISQVFLGARLQCAKCHNHPFERWTQDNYYGLGAFFQRVQRKKTMRPGEQFIWTSAAGEVTQPRTGEVMKPWLPQAGSVSVDASFDRREPFVEWLIRPDNPYFARIEVNRIWSNLFSRGIVDPIDDFRDSNPPANEPLLDALSKDFAASGFDRKKILKTMLRSRTYQASFQTNQFNKEDTKYFSHQEPRLLSAEQLLDALNQAIGTTQVFGALPKETKATQLPAPDLVKVDFLKVFGQPERATVCACERTEDSNLGMAIELFNGPLVYEKLRNPSNRFRKGIADGKSVEEVVRLLYLAAVCRPPSDFELRTALDHCKSRNDQLAGLEDVCWALINTDEFLFQH